MLSVSECRTCLERPGLVLPEDFCYLIARSKTRAVESVSFMYAEHEPVLLFAHDPTPPRGTEAL